MYIKNLFRRGLDGLIPGICAIALAAISAAAAQETVSIEEALQICNRIKGERDRLDCFEGLARAADPESKEGDASVKEGPVTIIKPAPAEGTRPEATPTSPEKPSTRSQTAADRDQAEDSAAPAAPRRDSEQRVIILTEEQAKERLRGPLTPREKGERYEAKVRKAWFNGERKLFVLLDNGELWKQSQSKRPTLPKPGDPVSLKKSAFGSWFVRLRPGYPSVRMTILNP